MSSSKQIVPRQPCDPKQDMVLLPKCELQEFLVKTDSMTRSYPLGSDRLAFSSPTLCISTATLPMEIRYTTTSTKQAAPTLLNDVIVTAHP